MTLLSTSKCNRHMLPRPAWPNRGRALALGTFSNRFCHWPSFSFSVWFVMEFQDLDINKSNHLGLFFLLQEEVTQPFGDSEHSWIFSWSMLLFQSREIGDSAGLIASWWHCQPHLVDLVSSWHNSSALHIRHRTWLYFHHNQGPQPPSSRLCHQDDRRKNEPSTASDPSVCSFGSAMKSIWFQFGNLQWTARMAWVPRCSFSYQELLRTSYWVRSCWGSVWNDLVSIPGFSFCDDIRDHHPCKRHRPLSGHTVPKPLGNPSILSNWCHQLLRP